MNPVTQRLLQDLDDPELTRWIEQWNALESLIIEIYRSERVDRKRSRRYQQLRQEVTDQYPRWREELTDYWQGRQAGGDTLAEDPFRSLLAAEEAASFVNNWRAMQTLPAAREALNEYLLDQLAKD